MNSIMIENLEKPFGCKCTILKQKDHLGKFETKSDDGFFVGYSSMSMAYRVYNIRNRIIEESPNVTFLERTENQPGTGPSWLFDIDSLMNSFNLPIFQDVTGTVDLDKGDDEDEIVVRTADPPCYLNDQSSVQGEPSIIVQGEH